MYKSILLLWLLFAIPAFAQIRIGTGNVKQLYTQHCGVCHGEDLGGGPDGTLYLVLNDPDRIVRRVPAE